MTTISIGSFVGWGLYYLILLAVAIAAAAGILVALAKFRERHGPRADATRVSIRDGSSQTFISLVTGLGFGLWVAFVIWDVTARVLGWWMAGPAIPPTFLLLRHLLGLGAGIMAGYALFEAGRFNILPGTKAYLTLFGFPFGNLGPGWGWRIPGIMEVKERTTQAVQDTDGQPVEYITETGVQLFIDTGATVQITDPLLAEAITAGDIQTYINSRKKAAVRAYVARLRIELDLAFRADLTADEQEQVFLNLIHVKGDVSVNGPSQVKDAMNIELEQYGMTTTQIQFEEVSFNQQLEQKLSRAFDEIAEGPGLKKDILNKAVVIETLYTRLLEISGVSQDTLTPEQKFDLLKRAQAYALAAEGQGNYSYQDFGSAPPRGILVNVNQPQQPRTTT